jgi:predicted phage terminase large subunit-like protein
VKAVHSAVERDRTASDFFNNLLNLLEPDGRFWSLSTPWHNDDLNARLQKNPAYTLFRRAVGKNLEPVWDTKWPAAELAKRRAEIGDAAFARGYWLTPVAEDEIVIRPEWVRYSESPPARFDQVLLSVDPAASGKRKADRHGLVVLGRDDKTLHVLAASALRCGMTGLIAAIESLSQLWNADTIVFESNGAFEAVRELLVKHTAFGAKVRGVAQVKTKHDRATALSVSVQNGSLLFKDDGSQAELIEEMTTFPFAAHDDLLDALGTGVRELIQQKCQPRLWVMG